ncbi:CBS domain-containing protein [Natrarchaeobius halalkaliphilus]|uniref:CBS domain-containing protein n=1 Tax=Natrarchaeobius halalkaliphilus TaxID=1679091 RepID=A0A3N6M382_9EURY|nr:CBS domain-containing protein [Natrarchaeobius halalkaliphilus]RQG90320.1 CBS domain-containing protein [Natrarchaeobius halalkaliphilus]
MESELSVRDVLTTEYVGVSESDTVLAAVQLMREERASCVLVVRGSEPVGIMTEWDVLGIMADEDDPTETTVGDAMTAPVISLGPDRSLADAATMMGRENIRNVVVEAGDEVFGLVTQRDVITAAGSFQATMTPTRSSASTGSVSTANEVDTEESVTRSVSEAADERALPNGGDEFSTQGVCEACGSLSDALWDANGRLVCSDCRSV